MSITDGFDTADSLGALPSSVLAGSETYAGVTIKVYTQECQGYAQEGIHGWYHVGVDVVNAATDEIIDSIPYQKNSDPEHAGHYTLKNASREAAMILTAYVEAYESAKSNSVNGMVDEAEWVKTFYDTRDYRRAAQKFEDMMIARLLASLDDDDSSADDDDTFFNELEKLLGVDPDISADVLGDFDPFAAGPTDEGLTDGS